MPREVLIGNRRFEIIPWLELHLPGDGRAVVDGWMALVVHPVGRIERAERRNAIIRGLGYLAADAESYFSFDVSRFVVAQVKLHFAFDAGVVISGPFERTELAGRMSLPYSRS